MKQYNFPIDYFGVLTDALMQKLLKPAGDKRKRKTAAHALVSIIKLSGQIPKDESFKSVGAMVDTAGQLYITVLAEESMVDKTIRVFGRNKKHLFVPDHTGTRGVGICFYCDKPAEDEVHSP